MLDRRRRRQLGDGKTCSNTSRLVRGGVGFLLGGLIGSMVGGGIATVIVASAASPSAQPEDLFSKGKTAVMVTAGGVILGSLGGLAIGVHKPEC